MLFKTVGQLNEPTVRLLGQRCVCVFFSSVRNPECRRQADQRYANLRYALTPA